MLLSLKQGNRVIRSTGEPVTENSVCTASPQLLGSLGIFTKKHYVPAWGQVRQAVHSAFWVPVHTSYPGGFPNFLMRSFPASISYNILETFYQNVFLSLWGPKLYSLDGISPGNLILQKSEARTTLYPRSSILKTLLSWHPCIPGAGVPASLWLHMPHH